MKSEQALASRQGYADSYCSGISAPTVPGLYKKLCIEISIEYFNENIYDFNGFKLLMQVVLKKMCVNYLRVSEANEVPISAHMCHNVGRLDDIQTT